MTHNKNIHFGGLSIILHSVIVPLFAFAFVILYRPFGLRESLQMENASFTFNITILLCILLGSTVLSRGIMYISRKIIQCNTLVYSVWCVSETIVAGLFISLYYTLMTKGALPFYEIAGSCIGKLMSISLYPYLAIYLGMEVYAGRSENGEIQDPSSLVRFYDEYKKLRFVIAPEAVLFVKSEENYVQIYYLDQQKTKKHILRSSMRALEGTLSRHGLIRCHRSYFINPQHIKLIHRDSTGTIVAEMKQDGFDGIPISRKYHEELTRLI